MSPGVIHVDGLRFEAVHGLYEEERRRSQPFVVDLELHLDLAAAARSDDVGDTCDYARAAGIAAEVMAGPPRRLLEALAGEIAARLLAAFRSLDLVRVRVHKPQAPIGVAVGDVSVEVVRRP